MVSNDNTGKPYNSKAMYTRFLMIWIPFLLIGFILLLFAGVAYLLLWISVFHLMITSTVFIPRIGRFILGKQIYQIGHEALIKMGQSKKYKIYWVISNIFWVVVTIISFNYNVSIVDFL